MNISVCIITKDERDYLERCLECLSRYPFEIVVVDTGSEDDSVEVARKYTDRVYEFEWCNDFSAARNFSVSKAGNDMIMIVDTDEFIKPFDYDAFIKTVSANRDKVGRINLNNVYTRNGALNSTNEKLSRIFDRRYYKYQGSVHEQIVSCDGKNFETYEAPVEYKHVGYDGDENQLRDKAMRNIALLEKELEAKEDPYILYQIGKSYYMLGDYENALGY
ncbi:MAG: glycosyltransferase family 2 protein, partial [Lachnospiraceae bacterium]|nr:glycosyltransferase family 2 protein [Lachnospiraceae bacterium]